MAIEHEKRYLLLQTPPIAGITPIAIEQGYLSTDPHKAVRIRRKGDSEAFLTVKGLRVAGTAPEFEYPIPVDDAVVMLAMCGQDVLTKNRYEIKGADNRTWEVDIFTGRHAGLMIAELELPQNAAVYKPDWIAGPDITNDNRFSNSALVQMSAQEVKALMAGFIGAKSAIPHS